MYALRHGVLYEAVLPKKKWVLGIVSFLMACRMAAISPAQQALPALYQESRRLMGTKFEIAAFGPDIGRQREAIEAAFEEIERLERQMNYYSKTSELTHINHNAARAPVIVEKELFDLLAHCIGYSRATGGAFDITVGPLMKAWGFHNHKGRVPEPEELQSVMNAVGYEHVTLESSLRMVRFDREGIELDLGGIAKGYAVDKAAKMLRESGVDSALITAGTSSICAIGAPPGQSAWNVAVSDPRDRSQSIASIQLRDQSISTSSCYEKTFKVDGRSYCHIMDPRTGRPIEEIISATVVSTLGVEAEALSKAVIVLGAARAKELLKTHKEARAVLFHNGANGSMNTTLLNFEGGGYEPE